LGGTMASAEHEPITEVWGLKTVYFVSELGAQSAWCPNPVIGGTVPPPGSAAYGIMMWKWEWSNLCAKIS